jgi:hypothetical protein
LVAGWRPQLMPTTQAVLLTSNTVSHTPASNRVTRCGYGVATGNCRCTQGCDMGGNQPALAGTCGQSRRPLSPATLRDCDDAWTLLHDGARIVHRDQLGVSGCGCARSGCPPKTSRVNRPDYARVLRPGRADDPGPPVLRPGPGRGDPPRPAGQHHARCVTDVPRPRGGLASDLADV